MSCTQANLDKYMQKQFGDLRGRSLSSEMEVAVHILNVSKNLHLLSVILIG